MNKNKKITATQITAVVKLFNRLSKKEWVEVTDDMVRDLGSLYNELPKVRDPSDHILYFNYLNNKLVYRNFIKGVSAQIASILD